MQVGSAAMKAVEGSSKIPRLRDVRTRLRKIYTQQNKTLGMVVALCPCRKLKHGAGCAAHLLSVRTGSKKSQQP
jgi:hypothetical protein